MATSDINTQHIERFVVAWQHQYTKYDVFHTGIGMVS